ncbi:hypothetical protein [Lentibacillus halodurans]|nr:hypothetical protein [Lentibacillus halodurans]
MKKNVRKGYDSQSELLNGKSISIPEVKTIYKALLSQNEDIAHEIVDSVERNDYVRLSNLITKRNKIQTAIEEIEALHENDLSKQQSFKQRIADGLSRSAEFTGTKGEDAVIKVTNSIEKVNQSAHNIASKTLDVSDKTIKKGNQLNHKAGKYLVQKTSNGISKLADVIKDRR